MKTKLWSCFFIADRLCLRGKKFLERGQPIRLGITLERWKGLFEGSRISRSNFLYSTIFYFISATSSRIILFWSDKNFGRRNCLGLSVFGKEVPDSKAYIHSQDGMPISPLLGFRNTGPRTFPRHTLIFSTTAQGHYSDPLVPLGQNESKLSGFVRPHSFYCVTNLRADV